MLPKIIILIINRSFIPFPYIVLRGKIPQKHHIILKCLPVLPLLQPYGKSIFF